MEASGSNSDTAYRRRYGLPSASSIIQAPLSALLEYSGLLRGSNSRSNHQETEGLIHGRLSSLHAQLDQPTTTNATNHGEVSIRIIGAGEHEQDDREATAAATSTASSGLVVGQQQAGEVAASNEMAGMAPEAREGDSRIERGSVGEGSSQSVNSSADGEAADASAANGRDSSYQRYDIQQAARWIEQVLPFSLLLLVVFIRQHLQGDFSFPTYVYYSLSFDVSIFPGCSIVAFLMRVLHFVYLVPELGGMNATKFGKSCNSMQWPWLETSLVW